MAFGFFKKNIYADTIFLGGNIYTQDSELPWAEAVACKDGIILAVGDKEDILEYEGSDTEIVDLEGGTLLPGFIDTHGHPINKTFFDQYLSLPAGITIEDTTELLRDYVAQNPDNSCYLAIGFETSLFEDISLENRMAMLDEICDQKPILILSHDGFNIWFNAVAMNTVREAAEEDGVLNISVNYMLDVLSPIDFDKAHVKALENMVDYCQRGFTSVFSCGALDFLDTIYQDMLVELVQEGLLKQRSLGSFEVAAMVDPKALVRKLIQKRTNCIELDGTISCDTLKLNLSETGLARDEEYLETMLSTVADSGFNIHIDASDEVSAYAAIEILSAARNAGYRKNTFVLAHDLELPEEFLRDSILGEGIHETCSTLWNSAEKYPSLKGVSDVSAAVDALTLDASILLGREDSLGSVEKDKAADFAIFDTNPLDLTSIEEFKQLKAVMTVMNGNIVYDVNEDILGELLAATDKSGQTFDEDDLEEWDGEVDDFSSITRDSIGL